MAQDPKRCIYCGEAKTEREPFMWKFDSDIPTAWRCIDRKSCEARPTYHQPFTAIGSLGRG